MCAVIELTGDISVELQSIGLQEKALQDTHDCVSSSLISPVFPSARGVVEFVAADGSTVLLAATGNLRAFIAQRLNEDGAANAKAHLGPITSRIIAYFTGSAFESDWIVLERARKVDQGLYHKINEQNRRALLVFDSAKGSWQTEDTQSLLSGGQINLADSANTVIGPILTKKASALLGEALDDVFELCRFPKELAQAPQGTPCAYKQMGRCPGACDGSESMETYRGRFERAIATASAGVEHWKQSLKAEIQQASDAFDFEHAQLIKRQLEQVHKLPTDAILLARSMKTMNCVCMTPSVRKGWAMIWMLGCHGLVPVVGVCEGQDGIIELIESLQSPITLDQVGLDRFALVARHWMTKPSRAKRRRVTILDLSQAGWQEKINQAIADACQVVDLDQPDEEHTHIVR